jgi:hypothetical protein
MINKMVLLLSFFMLACASSKIYSQTKDLTSIDSLVHKKNATESFIRSDSTFSDSTFKKIQHFIPKPVDLIPLYGQSDFLNKNFFDMNDYRYTGDILKNYGFNFERDYGSPGQPNETFLYGAGFNAVSYFEDGVLLNNRFTNSFDLNDVQSENIDSIEVAPLTRGFIYGNFSNSVSVNFISKDFISDVPFTRIKYYQGADGEAMIDGMFNHDVFDKFKLFLDITNRKFDSSYVNTGFSQWIARTGLKFFLSDNWNIAASYSYQKSLVGLNGGVIIDSLPFLPSGINLYTPVGAPVYFAHQNQSFKQHYFDVKILGNYNENFITNLSFYYNFNFTELNNYTDTLHLKNIDKEKIFGISLNQKFSYGIFQLKVLSNFENSVLKYYSLSGGIYNYYPVNSKIFSLAPIVSLNILDSCLIPSIFIKYSNDRYDENYIESGSYTGFGGDINFYLKSILKFYLGASRYQTGYAQKFTNVYETGIGLIIPHLDLNLKLFRRENFSPFDKYFFIQYNDKYSANMNGISADINLILWKIALETHAYYYSNQTASLFYQFPQVNLTSGLYFESLLFKSNLNLKTGFKFDFIGKRTEIGLGSFGPNYKVDFSLAGNIQKQAIVYFTWENLFDAKYFIVPYYPVLGRNVRFGISWELFN